MKTCTRCKKTKPLNEFQVVSRNKDGHAAMCKSCKRKYDNAHYAAHPVRRDYIRANRDKHRALNLRYVWDFLLDHPCVDCNEDDPTVLQFDHQRDKVMEVSKMLSGGLDRIITEIEKCEVRCANCHMRKTAKDFGWYASIALGGR